MPDEKGQPTVEELKAKAYQPMEDAMKLHPFYRGKIETTLKCCIRDFQDFGIWYTPGVSKPCLEIKDDPEKVYEHTNKWNTVAVISDGTRVLGMGDIGPKAGMPVMEGKIAALQVPRRRRRLPAHGRHQGPRQVHRVREARAAGARRRQPRGHRPAQVLPHPRHAARGVRDPGVARRPAGHGLRHAGRPGQRPQGGRQEDRRGQDRLHRLRSGQRRHQPPDLRLRRRRRPSAVSSTARASSTRAAPTSRPSRPSGSTSGSTARSPTQEQREGGIAEALKDADVCIALSKQGPDTIQKDWIRAMAPDPIVFVCANPMPEMWPWDAKEAGAAVVATGRSDFPNQVNNSVGFPGIFRGTLDVRAKTITDEMCIAAAVELAKVAEDKGLQRRLHHADHGRLGGLPARGRGRGDEGHRAGHRPAHRHHVRAGGRRGDGDHRPRPRPGAGRDGARLHPHARGQQGAGADQRRP